MEIWMLRHGATAANLARRYAGRTDEPLCEAGIEELREKGALPGVPCVYVSPLLRARQTAALMFPGAGQVVVPGLAEMDFGAFEGRNADEMADDTDYRAWVAGGCVGRCPGGEERAGFVQRSRAAFAEVVRQAAEAGDERAYIVAHGGTLMAVMHSYAQSGRDYFDWQTPHGCGWRVWLDGGSFVQAPVLERYERVTGLLP